MIWFMGVAAKGVGEGGRGLSNKMGGKSQGRGGDGVDGVGRSKAGR